LELHQTLLLLRIEVGVEESGGESVGGENLELFLPLSIILLQGFDLNDAVAELDVFDVHGLLEVTIAHDPAIDSAFFKIFTDLLDRQVVLLTDQQLLLLDRLCGLLANLAYFAEVEHLLPLEDGGEFLHLLLLDDFKELAFFEGHDLGVLVQAHQVLILIIFQHM